MADRAVQFRRGTTTQHSTFIGLVGEITVDTDKNVPVVHDGTTEGGFPLALESDLSSTQTGLSDHKNNTLNPHSVSKTQVGLANVTNDAQLKIASNLADLQSVLTARSNLDLVLQADGGDVPQTGRTNTWNARQNFTSGIQTIGGTDANHARHDISDDTDTAIQTVYDSAGTTVGTVQAVSLDGAGGGIFNLSGWDDVTIGGSSVHHAGNTTNRIRNLTAVEVTQLEAIGSVTISNTQWGYVGNMNQSVSTGDNVAFADITQNGNNVMDRTDMLRIFDTDGSELTY